jgi:DNA-binding CsgD family transcriptional regulator
MGLPEIIEGIECATTFDELRSKLQSVIESYGFSGFSFVDAGRPHLDEPFYASTTGNAWETEYRTNNFVHVDPCVSLARRTNTPFPWSSIVLPPRLGKRKPAAHALMEAAQDHGFTGGYVFPFHFVDYQGRTYSTVNGLFWKDDAHRLEFLLSSAKRHELNLALLYWTQRAIDLAGDQYRHHPTFTDLPRNESGTVFLTDRERDVLTWAGRGLTVADTSDVLKIGEETVQTHVRHAIEKLSATNKTHAVAKALRLGLIDL